MNNKLLYHNVINKLNVNKLNVNKLNVNKVNVNKLNVNKLNINKSNINKLNINKSNINKLNINKLNINKSNNNVIFKVNSNIDNNKIFNFIIKKNIKGEYNYTAIIIEPRRHNAFKFVLENFIVNLDSKWCIIIFCSDFNFNFVLNIINKFNIEDINRIKIIRFTEKNINVRDYNNIMCSLPIYNYILTDIFLVFQTDTLILNKNKIYKFLDYDYVGAPWKGTDGCGNGGLSLRKKSKMIDIIKKIKYNNQNEDLYFSHNTKNKPISLIAKEFSVESVYYDSPFGIHKCWAYSDGKNILNKYDSVKKLKSLQ